MLLQKVFHVIFMLQQKGYHRILGAFGIKEKKEEEPIIETGRQRQYHRTGCKQYFFLHLLGDIFHLTWVISELLSHVRIILNENRQ